MYEVTVKEVPELPALMVRTRATVEHIAEAMGQAFAEIMEHMGRSGIGPAGPPFCLYAEDFDPEKGGDMQVCVPAAPGATAARDIEVVVVPGGRMASTVHRGPYGTLGQAYAAMSGWIEEHGHRPVGQVRDVYLTDPHAVPPEEYLTEVLWPIA